MRPRTPWSGGPALVAAPAVAAALALAPALGALGAIGGCGDTENESAACDARNDLDESVSELTGRDLASTNLEDLRDDFEDVEEDLGDLRRAADEDLQPEIDGFEASLGDLRSEVEDLGSGDSVSGVGDALAEVRAAARALWSAAASLCD